MKIARLAGLAATAVMLSTVAACGGGSTGASSPEDAVKQALEAGMDEDVESVCKLTLNDDDKPLTDDEMDDCVEEGKKSVEEAEKQRKDLDEDSKKIVEEQEKVLQKVLDKKPKVGEEKDGEVVVTYDLDGTDVPFTTKKVDGNWYVKN